MRARLFLSCLLLVTALTSSSYSMLAYVYPPAVSKNSYVQLDTRDTLLGSSQYTNHDPYIIVVRGADNKIYYTLCNNNTCNNWVQLPGSTPDAPSVAVGREGRAYIAVRGMDNGIYFGYINLNNWTFSGWTKLPGSTPSRPVITFDRWVSEMVALVVRGMDNGIYYNILDEKSLKWSGWKRLPTGSTIDAPAAAIIDLGLQIVVRGSDGKTLWHSYLDRYDWTFSGWTKLPGSTPSAPYMISDGYRLWLAVRGMDNKVYINCWGDDWVGWKQVPTGSTISSPAIELGPSILHLVVIGSDGKSIWYTQLDMEGSQISTWSRIPGSSPSPVALAGI
jgi:hypothetical protein